MISVCIATYNGEKYIKEQLGSILKQLSSSDEIIISDDGSKDSTIEIIKDFNDDRIKIFLNEGIHGFTHNFENALNQANGDYIFLSDQDDIWVDNKVKVTLDALQKADLAISDCITVNNNMEVLQESRFKAFNIKPGFIRQLIKSRYLGCCMAFNRRLLEAAIPFPENDFLVEHDIWIAAVGFLYFKVKLIETPLIYYRRHGDNTSAGGFEKGYSMTNKIYRRIYRIRELFKIKRKVRNIKETK